MCSDGNHEDYFTRQIPGRVTVWNSFCMHSSLLSKVRATHMQLQQDLTVNAVSYCINMHVYGICATLLQREHVKC